MHPSWLQVQSSCWTKTHPLNQPELPEVLDTASSSLGSQDWRGISFSEPVRTRFSPRQSVTLTGRVVATDPVDFNQILLVFRTVDDSEPVRFYGDVRRSGDFAVTLQFTDSQRGRYSMGVGLFWPNSGSQYPRSTLSTVVVE